MTMRVLTGLLVVGVAAGAGLIEIEVEKEEGQGLGMKLNGQNTILSFVPGGVTEVQGKLRAGDVIHEVDGISLKGKKLSDVLDKTKTSHVFGVKHEHRISNDLLSISFSKKGASLGFKVNAKNVVTAIIPGGAAEENGQLRVGDVIKEVNGDPLDGDKRLVDALTGPLKQTQDFVFAIRPELAAAGAKAPAQAGAAGAGAMGGMMGGMMGMMGGGMMGMDPSKIDPAELRKMMGMFSNNMPSLKGQLDEMSDDDLKAAMGQVSKMMKGMTQLGGKGKKSLDGDTQQVAVGENGETEEAEEGAGNPFGGLTGTDLLKELGDSSKMKDMMKTMAKNMGLPNLGDEQLDASIAKVTEMMQDPNALPELMKTASQFSGGMMGGGMMGGGMDMKALQEKMAQMNPEEMAKITEMASKLMGTQGAGGAGDDAAEEPEATEEITEDALE